MKCNDCGKTNYEPSPHMRSICEDCWKLREQIVESIHRPGFDFESFKAVQASMNSGRYEGARAMSEYLGLNQPEI